MVERHSCFRFTFKNFWLLLIIFTAFGGVNPRTIFAQETGTPFPRGAFGGDQLAQLPPANIPAGNPREIPVPQPQGNNAQPLLQQPAGVDVEGMLSPQGMSSTLKIMVVLTVLSLAPSILLMTTCFIRFVIVLGLLRQALGTQQLPPNQVLVSLCMFLTFLIMAPVWKDAYNQGIRPYTSPAAGEQPTSLSEATEKTLQPLRRFMSEQIESTDNSDAVWLFLDYQKPLPGTPEAEQYQPPESYEEVPLTVLLPAYMLSELKTAFVIGFQIYLPFLIIDMVVSSILISMGMMMLPPVLISIPFKILLFVMIDGWFLTVGMMLTSVRPLG